MPSSSAATGLAPSHPGEKCVRALASMGAPIVVDLARSEHEMTFNQNARPTLDLTDGGRIRARNGRR